MTRKKQLLIDTATVAGFIALYEGSEKIEEILLPPGLRNSTTLFPLIEDLFSRHDKNEIDWIACGVGPGSYTGIRVGATVAKLLAYSFKKPLVGLSSLSAFIPKDCDSFTVALDAKIGGIYLQQGSWEGQNLSSLHPPQLLSWEEALPQIKNTTRLVTPDIELRKKFYHKDVVAGIVTPQIETFANLSLNSYFAGHASVDASLNLIYLRRT